MAKKESEKIPAQYQKDLKAALGISYMNRTLDAYSANLFTLRDICWNNPKSGIHHLGYEYPEDIPFYPIGDSFRAATAGTKYNIDLVKIGDMKIQYDFSEAYPNLMRSYWLPSNTFLKNVKLDREKLEERFSKYVGNHPYREMKTFSFLKVNIVAFSKDSTYLENGAILSSYRNHLIGEYTLTEIELKLIYDFYVIEKIEILDSYVFRCRNDMFNEYFEKIDLLKSDPVLKKFYKPMRNKAFGQISMIKLHDFDKGLLKENDPKKRFPIRNRATGSAITAIFRDKMVRYEQKYVNSEYVLFDIKTDALYFTKEVPEFEQLAAIGIVKKKTGVITEKDLKY